MPLTSDLANIVGSEFVKDDPKTITTYSYDQSFVPSSKPDCVVFPQEVEQVQEVLRLANQINTPIIPYSSGLNLHGATIPHRGGIILNLSRMNQIEINEEDWFAIVEPGVTFKQLQTELDKIDLRIIPSTFSSSDSLISSYLARYPTFAQPKFEYTDLVINL